jgi:hypothetical protein
MPAIYQQFTTNPSALSTAVSTAAVIAPQQQRSGAATRSDKSTATIATAVARQAPGRCEASSREQFRCAGCAFHNGLPHEIGAEASDWVRNAAVIKREYPASPHACGEVDAAVMAGRRQREQGSAAAARVPPKTARVCLTASQQEGRGPRPIVLGCSAV